MNNTIILSPIPLIEMENLIKHAVKNGIKAAINELNHSFIPDYMDKNLDTIENILTTRALFIIKEMSEDYDFLFTLRGLVEFFKKKNDNNIFLKQRNCGKKTNKELIELVSKYSTW
jgi:hypothetical protein